MNQLEEYLQFCSIKGLSAHSLRAYRTDLTKYVIWIVSRDEVNAFAAKSLQGWLALMREKSLSQRTLKRRLASIRAWYNWLVENKLIEPSEFSVPKVRVARTLPRNLAREDLATLFKQSGNITDTTQYEELVTVTLVELLFQTGLRISEACSLKLNDYDQRLQSIRVMGKGMRERIVYIVNDASKSVVTQYLQKRSKLAADTDLFFLRKNQKPLSCDCARRLIHKYSKKWGLKIRLTPHMLRHSAATELLSFGVDLRSVQRLLGHSSIAVTEIYTHVSEDGLRASLARANPRHLIEKCADN